jgi:hypothetical protein
MKKYYTSEQILDKFYKLSSDEQAEIFWDALNNMQQYNGRTKVLCIALAMGYDNTEGDNKSFFKV